MSQKKAAVKTYGFFHPYCNAGGGGERVLWQAVAVTLRHSRDCRVVVYTGDRETSTEILGSVSKRFAIELDPKRVQFVKLSLRWLVDPAQWPVLTLLGQAIGSFILAIEAAWLFKPDVWIDTMGFPFAYHLVFAMLGVPIVAYVHFPVISQDMLNKLHPSLTSLDGLKQMLKCLYWNLFMSAYSTSGMLVDVALANSTWTRNHIASIWPLSSSVRILYPPCSTEKFITKADIDVREWGRENSMICLAQFRPEKRHLLIIEEYAKFIKSIETSRAPKLVLIGSIRGEEDESYVKSLQVKADELEIPKSHIEFVLDAPYSTVQHHLRTASYGLNAMWNEHFGIAVVEYVASGLVPIVHASAGPLLDIVTPWDSNTHEKAEASSKETRTGFFFKNEHDPDYVDNKSFPSLSDVFTEVTELSDSEKLAITKRGKQSVLERFSDEKFDTQWEKVLLFVDGIKKRNVENVYFTLLLVIFGVSAQLWKRRF